MDLWKLLLDIVVLLTGCLIAGGIVARLGQSPLLGYLAAGMLLGGPGSVHLLQLEDDIEAIAELGVSLLLFSLGLEFAWRRLVAFGKTSLIAGGLQVVLTTAVAAGAAMLAGLPWREATAVGAMIALSSTACVLRMLAERGQLDSLHGRNAIAVLLVQDIAVVPLAIGMTLLGGGGSMSDALLDVGRIFGIGLALVAVLYVLLNVIAVRALGRLMLERNRELTVLLAVVTGLGAAWGAHAAGLSPAIGAFVAGLFLAGSPFATQIRADISSLRVVLLTLFFGAAGMVADPLWMLAHPLTVLGISAAIVVGKTVLAWAAFKIMGQSSVVGASTGLCLAQIGEFAFVLGTIGVSSGVIAPYTYQAIVSGAIFTLFLTPFLVPAAPTVGALVFRLRRRAEPSPFDAFARETQRPPDVVIVGFGPAGQHVAEALENTDFSVHVIELNPRSLSKIRASGLVAYIGDATQRDILEHAHVEQAKLIVISLPDRHAAIATLEHVRRMAPHTATIVRCRHDRDAPDISAAGAYRVAQDEQQVGRELARLSLENLLPSAPAAAPDGAIATSPIP